MQEVKCNTPDSGFVYVMPKQLRRYDVYCNQWFKDNDSYGAYSLKRTKEVSVVQHYKGKPVAGFYPKWLRHFDNEIKYTRIEEHLWTTK